MNALPVRHTLTECEQMQTRLDALTRVNDLLKKLIELQCLRSPKCAAATLVVSGRSSRVFKEYRAAPSPPAHAPHRALRPRVSLKRLAVGPVGPRSEAGQVRRLGLERRTR